MNGVDLQVVADTLGAGWLFFIALILLFLVVCGFLLVLPAWLTCRASRQTARGVDRLIHQVEQLHAYLIYRDRRLPEEGDFTFATQDALDIVQAGDGQTEALPSDPTQPEALRARCGYCGCAFSYGRERGGEKAPCPACGAPLTLP